MDPANVSELEEFGPPVRTLTSDQRRALGALMEKGFTTPDQYPLTIKSLTAACSQKSNRDPVQDYTEDEVADALQELQELGLVAEVHTDGGRTPRYRHLVRKRYQFTEAQFAILAELWLRGRQQMGELRSRASRMSAIDTQEDLRTALQPLLAEGFVRASGPLERRGVEVDHGFYPQNESAPGWSPVTAGDAAAETAVRRVAAGSGSESSDQVRALTAQVEELSRRVEKLEQQLESLLH